MAITHVMPGDEILLDGKWVAIGESRSFKDESELRAFLANAHEETRTWRHVPFLAGIFGGVISEETKRVWVSNG